MHQLTVRDVVTGYGDMEIVHGVNMDISPGSVVTVIGPNGAGKSTLIKAITGFIDIWDGRVEFGGTEITHMRPDERAEHGIAFVPQSDNVFPTLTVRENLHIGSYLDRSDFKKREQDMYDLFPALSERVNQKAGTMSGGQRQMLALARALMIAPDLLILDEPTAGVQPNLVDEILDLIREINTERNVAVLMIEQNAQRALERSDQGYVLANGEVAHHAEAASLLHDDDVIETFLGG
jgi:branched-chain amino acid transport system ATP-binding protein